MNPGYIKAMVKALLVDGEQPRKNGDSARFILLAIGVPSCMLSLMQACLADFS
jgi:hypothetical protein